MERRESSCTIGRNVNWHNHYGEQHGDALKTKNRATIWPCNPTPGHISREKHEKDKCTPMFTAALFTIAKPWKQPECPLTEERTKM